MMALQLAMLTLQRPKSSKNPRVKLLDKNAELTLTKKKANQGKGRGLCVKRDDEADHPVQIDGIAGTVTDLQGSFLVLRTLVVRGAFRNKQEPEALYSSSKYRRRDNSPVRERRSPVRGVRRRHVFSPEDIQTPRDQFRRRNWSVLSSPTVNPCDRSTPGWYDSHEQYKSLCRVQSDVVLVGDSIIKGLGRYPRVWRKYFGRLNALNLALVVIEHSMFFGEFRMGNLNVTRKLS